MTRFDWVLFGGSFDPPHLGHLAIVESILSRWEDTPCLVVPSYQPPQSKDHIKTVSADFSSRLDMAQIMFSSGKFSSRIRVLDIEKNLPVPSYTSRTLEAIAAEFPGQGAMVLGSDQLINLENWHAPRQILEQVSLIVVTRNRDNVAQQLARLQKALGSHLREDASGLVWPWGTKVELVLELSEASSTQIRTAPSKYQGWLHPGVYKFIEDKQLYRGGNEY